MATVPAGVGRNFRMGIRGKRGMHEDELVELRSLRERYLRQIELYQEGPVSAALAPGPDPALAAALEAAWRATQAAYSVWRDTYEKWDALRKAG